MLPSISETYKWQGKTILIAEDEEINYMLLFEALNRTGAKILHAEDGDQAVELIRNTNVDIILMDIKMPQSNGYEATREIKRINSTIPIIAQTAYALAGEKEQIIDAGCDDYIAKPIKINALLLIIEKHLNL